MLPLSSAQTTSRTCTSGLAQSCQRGGLLSSFDNSAQVLRLMRLAPADEEDRLAKAALYTKYAELLPATLVAGKPHSLQLVTDLLNGIKIVIATNVVPHQNLFR